MEQALIAGLGQFGPPGIFILYLMWAADKREKQGKLERDDRNKIDRDRIETDKALAASLAALTTTIQLGRRDV